MESWWTQVLFHDILEHKQHFLFGTNIDRINWDLNLSTKDLIIKNSKLINYISVNIKKLPESSCDVVSVVKSIATSIRRIEFFFSRIHVNDIPGATSIHWVTSLCVFLSTCVFRGIVLSLFVAFRCVSSQHYSFSRAKISRSMQLTAAPLSAHSGPGLPITLV